MRHEARFAALSLFLAVTVACGSAENPPAATATPEGQPPQGSALTTGAPGAAAGQSGQAATPASDKPLPADSGSASSTPRATVAAPAAPAADR